MQETRKPYNLLVILGPTAAGKTTLAAHMALSIQGEIISADSRQVYRKMDIGTGKDYDDYIVNGIRIPYHLIDIHDPGYQYNVYEYQKDAYKALELIRAREKFPVLCGGTGMYIEAVLKGYKLIAVPVNNFLRKKLDNKTLNELTEILSKYKKLHNKTDVDTKKRAIRAIEIEEYYLKYTEIELDVPDVYPLLVGVNVDRETRRQNITKRLKARLNQGMVEEVKNLLEVGLKPCQIIYYGLEYKYLTLYLTGELAYEEMFQKLNTAIHQFAKRQMTWFRKMERNGFKINWLDGHMSLEEKLEKVEELLTAGGHEVK
jgi:tRNA dimethylallyltransferase